MMDDGVNLKEVENFALDLEMRDKQQRIVALLTPIESYILLAERILVWELPYVSAALIISVHVLFWFATTVRIYCLFSATCMILVLLDVCFAHLMHSVGDDTSIGWTELHPRLLGVDELSHAIVKRWVSGLQLVNAAIAVRTSNRPKFFVLSIIYLTTGAVVGTYLPGFWLSYLTVMGLLMWPCLSYHNVLSHLHHITNLAVSCFEQKLSIKRKQNSGGKVKRSKKLVMVDYDSDSDDAIIDEFLPSSLNQTSVTVALASPLTTDELEEPSSTPSQHVSDQEETVSALMRGLGAEMPSVELDDSEDGDAAGLGSVSDSDEDLTLDDDMTSVNGDELMATLTSRAVTGLLTAVTRAAPVDDSDVVDDCDFEILSGDEFHHTDN